MKTVLHKPPLPLENSEIRSGRRSFAALGPPLVTVHIFSNITFLKKCEGVFSQSVNVACQVESASLMLCPIPPTQTQTIFDFLYLFVWLFVITLFSIGKFYCSLLICSYKNELEILTECEEITILYS